MNWMHHTMNPTKWESEIDREDGCIVRGRRERRQGKGREYPGHITYSSEIVRVILIQNVNKK